MSQNDFNIANQGFPATRADINSALQALASNSAGTAEPSTTYAYQFWYDETNELLKMRNSDNDAWITIGTFDQVADTFTPAGVTTDKIEEGNSSVEVVDTGTGYVAITVDGVEAARFDTSGNLLVGKTSSSGAVEGIRLSSDGRMLATATSNYAAQLNRLTTDGDVIQFSKDTTVVGSIGAASSKIYIGTAEVGLHFTAGATDRIQPWNTTTNSAADASIDLGISSARFRNLYLSGGVYLGGTGAANYLDDYEEGEFEATLTCGGSGTITLNSAINTLAYTKVGRQVTITGRINISSVSSPSGSVTLNLPFVSAGSLTEEADFALFNVVTHDVNIPSSAIQLMGEVGAGGSVLNIRYVASNAQWPQLDASNFDGSGNEYIMFSGTYLTP